MVLLGVFVEDREAIAGTLIGLGGVLMPLAVLLPRLTGSIRVSPTGLEGELVSMVKAEASAQGLPAQVTQRAVAVVESDTDVAVRVLAADLLVAVQENYPDLTEIPVHRARDLQQLMLGRQDRRLGQIDHLMTRRAAHNPALPGEIVPALAALPGTHRERLVGIVDELARRTLMAELATPLALRALAGRSLGSLSPITGRRQRAVDGVLTQPPLKLLQTLVLISQALILLGDPIKQRQHQIPSAPTAPKRDLLSVLSPQLHAP